MGWQDKLADDYEGTIQALQKADLAWYVFTASRRSVQVPTMKRTSLVEKIPRG